MAGTERYTHHGREVTVLSEVRGKHRELCLCYRCQDFHPGQSFSCEIARTIYEHCKSFGLVTPVFECAHFTLKEDPQIALDRAAARDAAIGVTAHEQQFES